MLELSLNETISRNKTNLTEKIARMGQLEEKVVVLQSKIESKNHENDQLWTTLEQEREGVSGDGVGVSREVVGVSWEVVGVSGE